MGYANAIGIRLHVDKRHNDRIQLKQGPWAKSTLAVIMGTIQHQTASFKTSFVKA